MLLGVIAGLGAGALWGLTFIAPLIAAPFTPFDLTVARYLVFGCASLVVVWRARFAALAGLSLRDAWHLVVLAFAGNVGYFLLMALAVPLAGSAVVALIVGTLPLAIGILGNRGAARLPWSHLAVPLALVTVGLLAVNGEALLAAPNAASRDRLVLGIVLTALATALWAWYAIANARALERHRGISTADWTALNGLGSLIGVMVILPLGPALDLTALPAVSLAGELALRFLALALAVGLLSSYAAMFCWSYAARHLPVSLTGQLIVSETLFALLYGWLWAWLAPTPGELAGGALLVLGVVLAVRSFGKARLRTAEASP